MDDDDKLKVEYEQCFDNWRFLVGLRFTVLAFFLTLTSVLLYGILTQPIFREKLYQFLVSFIGVISSWAVIMLEGRNRQLYYQCILRAKAIEKLFHPEKNTQPRVCASNCLAHLLDSVPRRWFAWHTGGIYIVYGIAILIWLSLCIAALLGKFPMPPATSHNTG